MRWVGGLVAIAAALGACAVISADDYARVESDAGATPTVEAGPAADGSSPPTPTSDAAIAAVDSIGTGDGHFGAKSIADGESVNAYAAIVSPSAVGATAITVDDPGPTHVGDAVMVWQTSTTSRIDASTTANIDGYDVGKYAFARVTAIAGTALTLDRALPFATSVPGAQVVLVPEYTSVTIGGTVKPLAWNGFRGGVVAMFVKGAFTVTGAISADAAGFRGGVSYQNNNLFGCTDALDGTPVTGYSAKGEGLVSTSYQAAGTGDPSTAPGGRGNATNGGGGGSCHNAGGAGGGNGSTGGKGGRQYDGSGDGSDIGGIGGSSVSFLVADRLVLGGGGGAGDRHQTIDVSGGNGGGVVFVRAASLSVTGTISANGATTLETDHDGAGGGGAGGTIALYVTNDASCAGTLQAKGADGGSTTMSNVGPGGGGGGGHTLLTVGTPTTCTFDVSSGVGGIQANASVVDGPRYGAEPTTRGVGITETN